MAFAFARGHVHSRSTADVVHHVDNLSGVVAALRDDLTAGDDPR